MKIKLSILVIFLFSIIGCSASLKRINYCEESAKVGPVRRIAQVGKSCAELFSRLKFERNQFADLPEPTWDILGDLTVKEAEQIQSIVNHIEFPIVVVGSAAKSQRRNIGTDFLIGKGEREKSDIDYVIPFLRSSKEERVRSYLFTIEVKNDLKSLPDLDGGIFVRVPEQESPRIWFIPHHGPIFVPANFQNPLPLMRAPLDVPSDILKQNLRPPTDILAF